MQRVFTKDVGANHHKGKIGDYPIPVWREIAKAAKADLDSFSTLVMSPEHPQELNPDLIGKKK